jgi:hypothetical protein
MIHGLYGLPHISLSQFNSLCKQQSIEYAIVSSDRFDRRKVGEQLSPLPVVIIGVINFLKTYRRFKKPVCIFVIDNPVQLEAVGATILGCTKLKSYHYTFYPVKGSDIRTAIESCGKEPLEIKLKKVRVIHEMLKVASMSSIMAPLQTAFYQIKDLESRTRVQDSVFLYLSGEDAGKGLKKTLASLESPKTSDKFKQIMLAPKFQALRKASAQVLRKKTSFERVAKLYDVPLYDVKYVCKKIATKLNIELQG